MRHRRLLMWLVVMTVIPLGCSDGDDIDLATVGCRTPSVQAGPRGDYATVEDCDLVKSPQTEILTGGEEVWVSQSGEARAVVNGCGDIYVYHDSGLRVGGCCSDCAGAGSDACSLRGTTLVGNECGGVFSMATGSAVAYSNSTWFTVTYLEDRGITLIAVLDGEVEVAPLATIDAVIEEERIQLSPGSFVFTMPDDQLQGIDGLEPRVAYSNDQLDSLVARFDLDNQFAAIIRDIVEFGIDPGALAFQGISIQAAGGVLSDPDVLDAVISSVDWTPRLEVLGDSAIRLVAPDGGETDIRVLSWDVDSLFVARDLLFGRGVDGDQLTVLVAGGDPALEQFARSLLESNPGMEFGEGGLPGLLAFNVEIVVVDPSDALATYQELTTAGIPVLWVTR